MLLIDVVDDDVYIVDISDVQSCFLRQSWVAVPGCLGATSGAAKKVNTLMALCQLIPVKLIPVTFKNQATFKQQKNSL